MSQPRADLFANSLTAVLELPCVSHYFHHCSNTHYSDSLTAVLELPCVSGSVVLPNSGDWR